LWFHPDGLFILPVLSLFGRDLRLIGSVGVRVAAGQEDAADYDRVCPCVRSHGWRSFRYLKLKGTDATYMIFYPVSTG
jgi:hypothetical protein